MAVRALTYVTTETEYTLCLHLERLFSELGNLSRVINNKHLNIFYTIFNISHTCCQHEYMS